MPYCPTSCQDSRQVELFATGFGKIGPAIAVPPCSLRYGVTRAASCDSHRKKVLSRHNQKQVPPLARRGGLGRDDNAITKPPALAEG